MNIFNSEGIVLNKIKYLESDLIVTIFLKDEGKIKAIAKGGAKSRKRFAAAFEVGNDGEFGIVEKHIHQLMRIEHAHINNYFLNIRKDYNKLLMLFHFLSITDNLLPEKQKNEKLFELFLAALRLLEEDHPVLAIRLFYESYLLKMNGILPYIKNCESCGGGLDYDDTYITSKNGRIICKSCIMNDSAVRRIPLKVIVLLNSINERRVDFKEFLSIDIPVDMFGFTMRHISDYIGKPQTIWQMINNNI